MRPNAENRPSHTPELHLEEKIMNDYGVDLGTVNTLICKKNKGIVVNEPSILAVDTLNNKTG